jgi:hypothetical protein
MTTPTPNDGNPVPDGWRVLEHGEPLADPHLMIGTAGRTRPGVPPMTTPLVHPPWCDPTKCTAAAGGGGPPRGSHQSRAIVIRRDNLRSEVFLNQGVTGPGRILVIIERYEGDEAEPTEVIGFRLTEAQRLTDAVNELLAMVAA